MARLAKILAHGLAIIATFLVLYCAYLYYQKSVPPKPCVTPITYRVGEIDPRFNISREDFTQALATAAAVWNTAHGQTLIYESSTSTLPVSLVYDTRQATVALGATISFEQAAYDAQKKIVDTKRSALNVAQIEYDKARSTFEAQAKAHSQKVAEANARGGATKSEYDALKQEQVMLQKAQDDLNARADALNAQAKDLNTQIASLNVLAQKTNQKVDVYNKGANQDFDQGLYIRDEQGKRITIYEFKNRGELTRVLAHELGHALGLAHNDNPSSIMYAYNSGSSLVLSGDDKTALRELCGDEK